jgi:hypothetical protein
MRDHSIFGETQCGRPVFNPSAGARTRTNVPCHGLFGTKLRPDEDDEARPGIRPDRLHSGLS